jgi:hypothetical protein
LLTGDHAVEGSNRPKADICPVNKSVPFSLRYIQPKVRMIVDALLEMAQRNAAVFRPD